MPDLAGISKQIWDLNIASRRPTARSRTRPSEDTWSRVALAVSAAETTQARKHWSSEFTRILNGFRFLPAGRVVAGAGSAALSRSSTAS